jgi:hypothetical protein
VKRRIQVGASSEGSSRRFVAGICPCFVEAPTGIRGFKTTSESAGQYAGHARQKRSRMLTGKDHTQRARQASLGDRTRFDSAFGASPPLSPGFSSRRSAAASTSGMAHRTSRWRVR